MGDKMFSRHAGTDFSIKRQRRGEAGATTVGWVAGGATDASPKLAAMIKKTPVGNDGKLPRVAAGEGEKPNFLAVPGKHRNAGSDSHQLFFLFFFLYILIRQRRSRPRPSII